MKFTLYNIASGEFGPIVTGPDESCLTRHVSETVGAKEGAWRRTEHRVVDGEIVPIEDEVS